MKKLRKKRTSKPCSLPTSIMSLAALGMTCMTCAAAVRPSISDCRCVRWVSLRASRSSNWYFMILCTGFMRRSHSCSRWPNFCLSSCITAKDVTTLHWAFWHKVFNANARGVLSPQGFFLFALRARNVKSHEATNEMRNFLQSSTAF